MHAHTHTHAAAAWAGVALAAPEIADLAAFLRTLDDAD